MVTQDNTARKSSPVRPRFYTTENAYPETGLSYRFIRDEAKRLGVKIHKFGKSQRLFGIDVEDFHAKAEAETARLEAEKAAGKAESPEDATAAVLKSLGLEAIR